MIFVGDIAHPFDRPPKWESSSWPWPQQASVGNLEGALVSDGSRYLNRRVLFNHLSLLPALKFLNVRALTLANNHITDIPGLLESTRASLLQVGISPTGAGSNVNEAVEPARVEDGGQQFLLFGFGWRTIECRPAGRSAGGVNSLEPARVLSLIERRRIAEPGAAIIALMHWNYELELYPQPAHRQLAFAAIEAGASAVIGHHPHRVGGVEFHLGAPIVYSLGNWWMPHGVFFNGKLAYPQTTHLQLAFEWKPRGESRMHWFEYRSPEHEVQCVQSEPAVTSARRRELTPFEGLSHREYCRWFRAHRVKRKALPIYVDYRHSLRNRIRDAYVHMRQVCINALVHFGLHGRAQQ